MKNYYLLFLSILLLSSCVSGKKYKATEGSLMIAETNLLKMKQQVRNLEKDTSKIGQTLRVTQKQKKELEEYTTYAQSMLYKQMNSQNSDLDKKNERIVKVEQELKRTKTQLEKVTASDNKNAAQLKKVEGYINAQNKLIRSLRLASASVTAGFEGKNVEYEASEGSVRVIIPESVLFSSNTTNLKKDGEMSLMAIANVIGQNSRFKVYVETHSDDNPNRDNWAFTSKRASSIAKFLIKGGVAPTQIVPSARAEFAPKAMNDTPENKAKNRRIELVLSPSFKDVHDLLRMY